MKVHVKDLHEHLFAQLERLGSEEITAEQLELETKRAKSICEVSEQIINLASKSIEAMRLKNDILDVNTKLPEFFEPTAIEVKK